MELKQLFQKSEPAVFGMYQKLMQKIKAFGTIGVEPKKTSIHITHGAAFLGVHPKKKWLDLNIVTETAFRSPRTLKTEQVSKNRFHNLVRINKPADIDTELLKWIKQTYELRS